ncbi:unnamed protein product [Pleuronectes platessa]|uniref:Uncharacterized protein n=1 Tax=Pleuronectes platessa TaxID=8262 RepID=A0A9N7YNE3_PLEPL|nr:unnamed protein product [Pleuronectes platessa]
MFLQCYVGVDSETSIKVEKNKHGHWKQGSHINGLGSTQNHISAFRFLVEGSSQADLTISPGGKQEMTKERGSVEETGGKPLSRDSQPHL